MGTLLKAEFLSARVCVLKLVWPLTTSESDGSGFPRQWVPAGSWR